MGHPPPSNTSRDLAPLAAWPGPRGVVFASYLLMGAALLLVMWRGLLPGLLCVCLGFLLTRWLVPRFAWLGRRGQSATAAAPPRAAQVLAAALVMLSPLTLVVLGLSHSRGYIVDAPQQYRELLDYMARTVLELRQKLPPTLPRSCPRAPSKYSARLPATWAPKQGHWPWPGASGWVVCCSPTWGC